MQSLSTSRVDWSTVILKLKVSSKILANTFTRLDNMKSRINRILDLSLTLSWQLSRFTQSGLQPLTAITREKSREAGVVDMLL